MVALDGSFYCGWKGVSDGLLHFYYCNEEVVIPGSELSLSWISDCRGWVFEVGAPKLARWAVMLFII
jgi:hypothetical protein